MASFDPKPFGKFFLTDKLAIGGMAEIYRAKTFGVDGFEKTVAIKKILPHYSADKEFIAMLTDEAKLVVRLSHANIVGIYDLGKVGDDYYISMEFIDGVNLRELLLRAGEKKVQIPVPLCLYIVSEICKGLDYAHSKRDEESRSLHIVHRDISPQNILISYEGETKIVDFGIAKAAMNVSQTTAGMLKGKVTYMSPEQALGNPVDHRTDIFSTGIILFELLTGQRLFTGDTQFEVLKNIRTRQVTADNLPESIPEPIRFVLARALAYKVENRYETAGDFQVALTKLLYTQYHDFSPRQVAKFVRECFDTELTGKNISNPEEGINNQTRMLLKEVPEQQSLIASGDGIQNTAILMDTTRPDSGLKPSDFNHGQAPTKNNPLSNFLSNLSSNKKILWGVGLVLLVFIGGFLLNDFLSRPKKSNKSVDQKISQTGSFDLSSTPSGAAIYIDNKLQDQTTPAVIEGLAQGVHLISLQLKGYQPFQLTAILEAGQVIPVEAMLLEVAPEVPSIPATTSSNPVVGSKGVLEITSEPSGATILLDDQDSGKVTPATIENLEVPSDHLISLTKNGFEKTEQEISLTRPEKISVAMTLVQKQINKPAKLIVKTVPAGASLYLDGLRLDDSGIYTLKGGSYLLRVEKTGYQTQEQQVTIAGEDQTLNITLNSLTGKKPEIEKIVPTLPVSSPVVTTTSEKKSDTNNKDVSNNFKKDLPKEFPTQNILSEKESNKPSVNGKGDLRIDSTPRGGAVTVDGAKAGVTPIVVKNLDIKKAHVVTVRFSNNKTWSNTITLTKGYTEINVKP